MCLPISVYQSRLCIESIAFDMSRTLGVSFRLLTHLMCDNKARCVWCICIDFEGNRKWKYVGNGFAWFAWLTCRERCLVRCWKWRNRLKCRPLHICNMLTLFQTFKKLRKSEPHAVILLLNNASNMAHPQDGERHNIIEYMRHNMIYNSPNFVASSKSL